MPSEYCPSCGSARTGSFRFCRTCGFDFDTESAPVSRSEAQRQQFSGEPGATRPSQGLSMSPQAPRPGISPALAIGGALLVVAIVLGGVILLSGQQVATSGAASPSVGQTARPTSPPPRTPTPTVTPAGFVDFAAIELQGLGAKVATFNIPEDAVAIATITHSGEDYFGVWAGSASGETTDLLVNTAGTYSGTVLFDTSGHSVALKIEANGSWTAVVKPFTAARAWDPSVSLTGSGDDVVLATGAISGLTTAQITHSGEDYFGVWAWSADGADLLVNESGPYNGEVLIPSGTILLEINADGTWAVTPT